jgi:hypothetical protein
LSRSRSRNRLTSARQVRASRSGTEPGAAAWTSSASEVGGIPGPGGTPASSTTPRRLPAPGPAAARAAAPVAASSVSRIVACRSVGGEAPLLLAMPLVPVVAPASPAARVASVVPPAPRLAFESALPAAWDESSVASSSAPGGDRRARRPAPILPCRAPTSPLLALPHLEALHRTALRLAGSRGEADDLVQQTYLEAQRAFATLREPGKCRPWLFAILRVPGRRLFSGTRHPGVRIREPWIRSSGDTHQPRPSAKPCSR